MTAFVAMALLAGMTVDEATGALHPALRAAAETQRQANLLRSKDRTVRAHALAVGIASVVRGLEALDLGTKDAPSPARRP